MLKRELISQGCYITFKHSYCSRVGNKKKAKTHKRKIVLLKRTKQQQRENKVSEDLEERSKKYKLVLHVILNQ